jgi:hypothetical protein
MAKKLISKIKLPIQLGWLPFADVQQHIGHHF